MENENQEITNLQAEILLGQSDALNKFLKENEAILHIITSEYAYLEVGKMRYYFHRTTRGGMIVPVEKEEITTFKGEKKIKTKLPYDGWEKSL